MAFSSTFLFSSDVVLPSLSLSPALFKGAKAKEGKKKEDQDLLPLSLVYQDRVATSRSLLAVTNDQPCIKACGFGMTWGCLD